MRVGPLPGLAHEVGVEEQPWRAEELPGGRIDGLVFRLVTDVVQGLHRDHCLRTPPSGSRPFVVAQVHLMQLHALAEAFGAFPAPTSASARSSPCLRRWRWAGVRAGTRPRCLGPLPTRRCGAIHRPAARAGRGCGGRRSRARDCRRPCAHLATYSMLWKRCGTLAGRSESLVCCAITSRAPAVPSSPARSSSARAPARQHDLDRLEPGAGSLPRPIRSCISARRLPMQRWMPKPKARWARALERSIMRYVGALPDILVAVAGDVPHHHLVALADGLAVHLDVLGCPASHVRERRLPADDLRHRIRKQLGVSAAASRARPGIG